MGAICTAPCQGYIGLTRSEGITMLQGTPEPVRLVIWDLDETFWTGTLSEGGISYRRDIHDSVVTLAKRGIVSSICSKNDFAQVKAVLEAKGIWPYFVFPSINWESKGPRLAELLNAVQLRAPTVLFIDDNPQNLAEARHYVPGLQTADESCIDGLLENPLLRGKNDETLTRLAQYKLLEEKHRDATQAGGDTSAFLRESGIRVTIEHDIEPHLDRAIELINRTNQLNFTKKRLSEDIGLARTELREMLAAYRVQAGIVRVQDRYGDYGYCGFYAVSSGGMGRALRHFCFSCRILNMGVETWLYRRLGRPRLQIEGEVLTDLSDEREIDWISIAPAGAADLSRAAEPRLLDYVYARGGCDLHAVTHYFAMMTDTLYTEFNRVRGGVNITFQHSMFARYAIEGMAAETRTAMQALGYQAEDFQSFLATPAPAAKSALWLLSFWSDLNGRLYRHRSTGAMLPLALHSDDTPPPEKFEFVGPTPQAEFVYNLRLILERAPPATRVFILLADEEFRANRNEGRRRLNTWTRDVAKGFANVTLLPMTDFILATDDRKPDGHHDRMVYYRVYEEIARLLQSEPVRTAAE